MRLEEHQGSHPPRSLHSPKWQCMSCGGMSPMTCRECDRCGLPMGYQKVGPQGSWQCQCGTSNAACYRFCRACTTPVNSRVTSSFGPVNNDDKGNGKGFRMAPCLAAHPRCPLVPSPPTGDWGKGQRRRRPPVIWRPHGTSPAVDHGQLEGQYMEGAPLMSRGCDAGKGAQYGKGADKPSKMGRWQPRVASKCALVALPPMMRYAPVVQQR